MGKVKCPFGYFFFLCRQKEGGEKLIILAEGNWRIVTFMVNGSLAMKLRGRKTSDVQSSKIYQTLSVQGVCVCVWIRMKMDRYDDLLNLMLCIAATDGGDKILSDFSALYAHSAKPQEKNKRAFGESVLCVLSKFEAWTIRDVANENKSCCVYIHAAHTCCTEWEKNICHLEKS